MRDRTHRSLAGLALLCAALAAPQALAQTAGTANIEGIVSDATGGVLPGVTVTVRNMDTNATRELVTDDGGRYRANALQPGRYEVNAALAGFSMKPLSGINASVGATTTVDVTLRPATVSEEVTVTAEAPLIDTTRTDVSSVVSETAIQNLPIN